MYGYTWSPLTCSAERNMGWRSIVVWYFARTKRLIKKSGISSNSLAVLKTEWYCRSEMMRIVSVLKTEWYLMAYCKT